jgi:hypothetical protein
MAENQGERRSGADHLQALDPSAEPAAEPADVGQPEAEAGAVRPDQGEREAADGTPRGACPDDATSEPALDESFDRDGMVLIAVIFLLIGLAVVLEFFWY